LFATAKPPLEVVEPRVKGVLGPSAAILFIETTPPDRSERLINPAPDRIDLVRKKLAELLLPGTEAGEERPIQHLAESVILFVLLSNECCKAVGPSVLEDLYGGIRT
jgi:hypothetical protein